MNMNEIHQLLEIFTRLDAALSDETSESDRWHIIEEARTDIAVTMARSLAEMNNLHMTLADEELLSMQDEVDYLDSLHNDDEYEDGIPF